MTTFEHLLIVENEPSVLRLLEHHLAAKGYRVTPAATVGQAEAQLETTRYDLILFATRQPEEEALAFLSRHRARTGSPPVMILSGVESFRIAMECIRAGASDYLTKPFSLDEIAAAIRRLEERRPPRPAKAVEPRAQGRLCGDSPKMAALRSMCRKVAPTTTPVLIIGECGVGKEQVAERIHLSGSRAGGPFVRIDCGSGTVGQLEAELFGDGQGKISAVEAAHGGTLVLENLSAMPHPLQVCLRLLLEDGRFERGGIVRPVDVRLIVTTPRELVAGHGEGQIRNDLFYLCNVFPIRVPQLRERLEDLPALVSEWMERYAERNGIKPCGITPAAMEKLASFPWPGNLRELENVLERAVILSDLIRPIDAEAIELPEAGAACAKVEENEPLLALCEVEKRQVLKVLEATNQNRTRAAGLLKISVRTLRNKLHQYRSEGWSPAPVQRSREKLRFGGIG
ncbi:MAG TPA: sigma-54 dependent transcriptional regulator [Chthoniobacteraceae bacterium]|nr:sigma-54 dependent transcriptional regulator [Chthoniobacteraceae bacterium]